MLTSSKNTVLYIGITNDLARRVSEHKSDTIEGFTKRYHIHKLVYYETYNNPKDAIAREKALKGITRAKKNALINSQNPSWSDLFLSF
jgi:putative endonuclease